MKRAAAIVLTLALVLGSGAAVAEWTKVRIGVEGAYPPFSWVEPDGTLKGFDIDIARALCEEMGVECELVEQDWDGIIPALQTRRYDAIVASMSITDERRERVDFTDKYYSTPAKFACAVGSGIEISEEGLAGRTVGVQRATIHDNFISDTFGDTVDIRRYGTQDEAYLDAVAGRLDCLMADSVAMAEGFLNTDDGAGFEFVGPDFTDPAYFGEGAGIAVRKGDDELREMFNDAIRAIREKGIYQEINARYFDFDVYGD